MTDTFNPNEHLLRIQGKEYLPVRWRLVWFHSATGSKAGYVTVEIEHDRQNGFAKFFTIAWDGADETWRHVSIRGVELDVCGRVATGEGSETRADFNDYYEKAATKALGRALAGLSFGTQFSPEMDEKERVVDTPVQRQRTTTQASQSSASSASQPQPPAAASAPQPIDQRAALRTQALAQGYTDESFDDLLQQHTYDGRVDLRQVKQQLEQERTKQPQQENTEPAANEQQLQSIRKLCAALGREEPAPNTLTFASAGALIRQLSRDYNNTRRTQKAS